MKAIFLSSDIFLRNIFFISADHSRPSDTEACPAPCDCQVGEWEGWSACSVSCHRGNGTDARQVRRREVEVPQGHGGRSCPQLEEVRRCPLESIPPCPRYMHSLPHEICTLLWFGLLCSVVVMSLYHFTHIIQGCITGNGAIVYMRSYDCSRN